MKALRERTKEQLVLAESAAVSRILDKVFGYAVAQEIDEMVFEASVSAGRGAVKFYDAGEPKGGLSFSAAVRQSLFSAIKSLAGISGKSSAQGEFKKDFPGGKVVFTASFYGGDHEKIIVSLSRDRFEVLNVSQLGFERKMLGRVKEVLENGRGLVLTVGPFNSGKTSSLYSFVNFINSPDLNITTYEREVSADMPSVNQSHIGHSGRGLSLSSILRQDPDVVMIDELVDKEGIESVLHLSDRGYFVLAGLYGQDFVSTVDFLQSLGISLPLFSSSLKMMVNQRLSWRNCPKCLERVRMTPDLAAKFQPFFSNKPFIDELKAKKLVAETVNGAKDLALYRGRGCEACRKKGVSGRIGVFEVLMMNEDVSRLIRGGHFRRLAGEVERQDGYSLAQSAFIKALSGIISPDEAIRIIEERRP